MKHLSEDDRFFIATKFSEGKTREWIADQLGRHPSTVSRELRRNACDDGRYRCYLAHRRSVDRKRFRTVAGKLENAKCRRKIDRMLLKNWSPEQISDILRASLSEYQVSHQTIYKYLWALPPSDKLRQAMRRRGRRPRRRKPGFINRARAERRSIHDRPKVVQRRKRLGDWELDLMTCHRNSGYLITAVERRSGYTLISRVKTKSSAGVMKRIIQMFKNIPKRLARTFTFDNGVEFYYFSMLERSLGVTVYFADPYNSGQRGTNENTNGLIRQYFPKQRRYATINQKHIQRAQTLLNNRPRKRLNSKTPNQLFKQPPKIAFQI